MYSNTILSLMSAEFKPNIRVFDFFLISFPGLKNSSKGFFDDPSIAWSSKDSATSS